MLPITVKGVEEDRNELIEVINASDMTQKESDIIMGLFSNLIQTYEREKLESARTPQVMIEYKGKETKLFSVLNQL